MSPLPTDRHDLFFDATLFTIATTAPATPQPPPPLIPTTATNMMNPYDDDPQCEICGGWPDHPDSDSSCSCPECPLCGNVGDPLCLIPVNDDGPGCGLEPGPYSVKAFLDHIGIAPLSAALRAIDRHNLEHVWLVLQDGRTLYYHHSREVLDAIPTTSIIRSVGAGCIASDGSDWEYNSEYRVAPVKPNDCMWWHADLGAAVDFARQDCHDAYDEYTSMTYRAAIWTARDGQADMAITSPEDAYLSDAALVALGRTEASEQGLDPALVAIGEWTAA